MKRQVLMAGHPSLRVIADPVVSFGPELYELLEDMVETMREHKGVGLAAPQIGVPSRVIVVECDGMILRMVNPMITKKGGGEYRSVEGCLSVPVKEWNQPVVRAKQIELEFYDVMGNRQRHRAQKLRAAIIQHEMDHLNGILFTDYIKGRPAA